jgi:hypothetical protein
VGQEDAVVRQPEAAACQGSSAVRADEQASTDLGRRTALRSGERQALPVNADDAGTAQQLDLGMLGRSISQGCNQRPVGTGLPTEAVGIIEDDRGFIHVRKHDEPTTRVVRGGRGDSLQAELPEDADALRVQPLPG